MGDKKVQQLIQNIISIHELELQGTALLRQRRSHGDGLFPMHVKKEEIISATLEVIEMADQSNQIAWNISELPAIPLTGVSLWEFGL